MRILYTLNSGNPGGMEQHVLDLVQGMVKSGQEVHVWCKEGDITNWFRAAGAKVTNQEITKEIDLKYISVLTRYLKENKIEVIHAHELKAVVNSLIAASRAGTKVRVTHTHTPISTWQVSDSSKKLNTFTDSFFVNTFATTEIALTDISRDIKIKEGIKKNKLSVIPNGIDVPKFDIPAEQKEVYRSEIRSRYGIQNSTYVFGNVSRLTEEKGHSVLLRAFKNFLDNNGSSQSYHLFIAGGGKLESELKDLIKSLALEGQVTITGIFAAEDLVKFYASFDSFIFPSVAEGFGFVLAEAMCSKLPVISSDLPVLKEISGGFVWFFETGNYVHLANSMAEITKYDRGLIAGAHDRVCNVYSLSRFVQNYLNLYSSLLIK